MKKVLLFYYCLDTNKNNNRNDNVQPYNVKWNGKWSKCKVSKKWIAQQWAKPQKNLPSMFLFIKDNKYMVVFWLKKKSKIYPSRNIQTSNNNK